MTANIADLQADTRLRKLRDHYPLGWRAEADPGLGESSPGYPSRGSRTNSRSGAYE